MNLRSIFRLVIILFMAIAFTPAGTYAQNELNWVSRNSMPNFGRTEAATFELNGKLYIGCGRDYKGDDVNDFWAYDPESNAWNQIAPYPGTGNFGNTSFTVSNRAFVGLGLGSTYANDLYEYIPATDTWVKRASLPAAGRYHTSAVTIGDSAYVIAGATGPGTGGYSQECYMYDPAADQWKKIADFPGGRCINAAGFSLHGYAYFGNMTTTAPGPDNRFWKYNRITDQWSSISDMPGNARRISTAFTYKNRGYVGCGTFSSSPVTNYQSDFYQYNTSTDNWTRYTSLNGFTPRIGSQAISVGDTAVFIMGGNAAIGSLTDCWQLKSRYDTCDEYLDTTLIVVYDTVTMSVNMDRYGNCDGVMKLKLYPNPASNGISVHTGDAACLKGFEVQVNDQYGRVLEQKTLTSDEVSFDLTGYPRAVYFLRFTDQSGNPVLVKRFILQ